MVSILILGTLSQSFSKLFKKFKILTFFNIMYKIQINYTELKETDTRWVSTNEEIEKVIAEEIVAPFLIYQIGTTNNHAIIRNDKVVAHFKVNYFDIVYVIYKPSTKQYTHRNFHPYFTSDITKAGFYEDYESVATRLKLNPIKDCVILGVR